MLRKNLEIFGVISLISERSDVYVFVVGMSRLNVPKMNCDTNLHSAHYKKQGCCFRSSLFIAEYLKQMVIYLLAIRRLKFHDVNIVLNAQHTRL